MSVLDLLHQLRASWVSRVSRQLARGAGVRDSFLNQLNVFFDALVQAVDTGDPSWIDPVLEEWADSSVETPADELDPELFPLLTKIVLITNDHVRETLPPEAALDVSGALWPVLTHAYEFSGKLQVLHRTEGIKRELDISQTVLEHVEATKSDFISVAAHELKTPLTLIEGYAAMIRELFPDEDEASQGVLLLKGIDNGTRRLREIIDDMIDVSLIDNNMLDLNFQPLWINRLLNTLKSELKDTLRERRQLLKVMAFEGSADMTYGDAERLYQALRNLLTNAVKYTPDGGSITVDGRKLPGFLEITVADTGIGIDPGEHQLVFQKFAQLGNISLHSSGKTKFKGGGPGLGLPITKGIVEAHGGTIWVESEAQDEVKCPGSTFHIMLPLWKDPPDEKTARLFRPQA
jgi:signal transduction histidine kinase